MKIRLRKVEWFPVLVEPQHEGDLSSEYDVDDKVVERWRKAIAEYQAVENELWKWIDPDEYKR